MKPEEIIKYKEFDIFNEGEFLAQANHDTREFVVYKKMYSRGLHLGFIFIPILKGCCDGFLKSESIYTCYNDEGLMLMNPEQDQVIVLNDNTNQDFVAKYLMEIKGHLQNLFY